MSKQKEYQENLIITVINNSESDNWEDAVKEWNIVDVEEDLDCAGQCTCGKEGLRYLFTIKNRINNNIIYPIGSSCISKFGVDKLKDEAKVKEDLFKLLHSVENNEYITISSDLFSRKLLEHLYNIGAFVPNYYNDFEPYNDYKFLLDMFNKRKRSEKQEKKSSAIIINSIIPFLRDLLENRIKSH